jgi:hypothetical protein
MEYIKEQLGNINQMIMDLVNDTEDGWQVVSLGGHQRTPLYPIVINYDLHFRHRVSRVFDGGRNNGDYLLIYLAPPFFNIPTTEITVVLGSYLFGEL